MPHARYYYLGVGGVETRARHAVFGIIRSQITVYRLRASKAGGRAGGVVRAQYLWVFIDDRAGLTGRRDLSIFGVCVLCVYTYTA